MLLYRTSIYIQDWNIFNKTENNARPETLTRFKKFIIWFPFRPNRCNIINHSFIKRVIELG